MTIYNIKTATQETAPYFFSRDSLKFFGQTMKDFRVYKQQDGRYLIEAPMYMGRGGNKCGTTTRYYNPQNNELERD